MKKLKFNIRLVRMITTILIIVGCFGLGYLIADLISPDLKIPSDKDIHKEYLWNRYESSVNEFYRYKDSSSVYMYHDVSMTQKYIDSMGIARDSADFYGDRYFGDTLVKK